MHSLVLERTESDLSKINWLRGVILLIPIVPVPWGRFPLCHTPIRPISASRDLISFLVVGCVITRFASGGIRARLLNKVISFCYFRAFFLVFLEVFQCFCSSPCSLWQRHLIKKKREVIFHRFLSLHFSILRRKEREIEALVEI